jgi:hypothetical protein
MVFGILQVFGWKIKKKNIFFHINYFMWLLNQRSTRKETKFINLWNWIICNDNYIGNCWITESQSLVQYLYFWIFFLFFKHHKPSLIKRQTFFEKRQKRQMRHDLLIAVLNYTKISKFWNGTKRFIM